MLPLPQLRNGLKLIPITTLSFPEVLLICSFLQVRDPRRNGANMDGCNKQMQSARTKVASALS